MARRQQSRWVGTNMDTFMRQSHSGVLGNPLTEGNLMAAINQPGNVRRQPPACASKHYAVLGRTDPLAISAADEAAFASLDAMLSEVDRQELESRSNAVPTFGSSSPSQARPSSSSRGGGGRSSAPSQAPAPAAFVDQFPPPPPGSSPPGASPTHGPDGSAPRAFERPTSQQSSRSRLRPPSRRGGGRRTHGPSTLATQQHNYSWSASSKFMPGAIPPGRRAAAASESPSRPSRPSTATSATLRSPDVLAAFGSKFAGAAGSRPATGNSKASASRPGSRGGGSRSAASLLRPSSSGTSFYSDSAVSTMSEAQARGLARSFFSVADGQTNGFRPRPAQREPIVPLIAPVPKPLLAKGGYGITDAASAQSKAVRQFQALQAQGGAQAHLRLVIADMMLGLQDEHHASLAALASSGASLAEPTDALRGGAIARARSAPRL